MNKKPPGGAGKARTALTALCLSSLLLLLPACQGRFIPSASPLPSVPGTRAPASEPPAPCPGTDTPAPPLSLEEYRVMVSAFHRRVLSESELLLRAGLYEYNWWGGYPGDPGGADLDAMLDEVMAWLAQTFDSDTAALSAARDELLASYAAISRADVEGGAPPQLSAQAEALFAAYCQLYATVTQPSGTVQEFVRMLSSCDHSITTLSAALASALEAAPLAVPQTDGRRLFPPLSSYPEKILIASCNPRRSAQ